MVSILLAAVLLVSGMAALSLLGAVTVARWIFRRLRPAPTGPAQEPLEDPTRPERHEVRHEGGNVTVNINIHR